jgi:hypothetical protein
MPHGEKLESLAQAIRLMEVCGLFGLLASTVPGERVLQPDIKRLLAQHEKSLFTLFGRAWRSEPAGFSGRLFARRESACRVG